MPKQLTSVENPSHADHCSPTGDPQDIKNTDG